MNTPADTAAENMRTGLQLAHLKVRTMVTSSAKEQG